MRAVVTVTGTDRRGIIAKVSGFLSEHDINIEDISQTIMGNQFAMIMMVDTSTSTCTLDEINETLRRKEQEMGLSIRIQREDIFQAMHRI